MSLRDVRRKAAFSHAPHNATNDKPAEAGSVLARRLLLPTALQLPSVARLVEIFGLTQAQARVAREFSIGGSYKEVARRLGVSVETVRSHIKDIYPKTRVNRQADLVRLILSLGESAV